MPVPITDKEVTIIEGLLENGVDAILINSNDATALKDVIDRAADKCIYIPTFDSDLPEAKDSCTLEPTTIMQA